MKKFLFRTVLLALAFAVPAPTMAGVDIHVGIPLPPPLVFPAPPEVIVIPETYVYAVPDVQEDVFFYNGWWWRPWRGRWYRSRDYSSGWVYYRGVPSFYGRIPSGWRNDYRGHHWRGHPWDHRRIPHHQLQRNWSSWEKSRHWEKDHTWGVQGLRPGMHLKQPTRVVDTPHSRQQFREVQRDHSRPQKHLEPQHREVSHHPGSRKGEHEGVKGEHGRK